MGEPAADRLGDEDQGSDGERTDEPPAIGLSPVRMATAMVVPVRVTMIVRLRVVVRFVKVRAHYPLRVMRTGPPINVQPDSVATDARACRARARCAR